MLALLKDQLGNADMAATATVYLIHEQLGAAIDHRYEALENAVSQLDFESAEQLCNELLESI